MGSWWPYFLIAFLIPAVAAPVAIRLVLKEPIHPKIEGYDLANLTQETQNFFFQLWKALEELGFSWAGSYVWHAKVDMFIVGLKHENRRDRATIGYCLGPAGDLRFIIFKTEFKPAGSLETTNSPLSGVFPRLPDVRSFRFPEIKNPARLYALHGALVKKYYDLREPDFPEDGTEIDRLKKGMVKNNEKLVKIGYYYLDKKGDFFRPTIKGACLMTWKQLWPISAIRNALDRRRAEALVRRLEGRG